MIKLSDLLECVSPPDEQTDLMNLAIATAKRMEAANEPGEVVTFKPVNVTRPHEWVIYRDGEHQGDHWMGIDHALWFYSPNGSRVARFPTAAEAQTYINANDIHDVYPWPVPKLTS